MRKKVILTEQELIKLIENITISESGGILKKLAGLFGKESKVASKYSDELAQVAGNKVNLTSFKNVDKKSYKNIKDTIKAEQQFLAKDLTLRQYGGKPLHKTYDASKLKMTFNELPNEARTWASVNKELPAFAKMSPVQQQAFKRRGEELSKVLENKEFEKYVRKRGKESADTSRKLESNFKLGTDIRQNDQALFQLNRNLDELQFFFSGNRGHNTNAAEFFQTLYSADRQMRELNKVVYGSHSRIVPIDEWGKFMNNLIKNFNMSKYKDVNVTFIKPSSYR